MTTEQPGLLLTETLHEHKYNVVAVNDGAAALKKIKEGKFDMVLMDVWMPKMNGLEVLTKLRSVKKQPKIIVMTSDDTPETLLRRDSRGSLFTYMAKPVDPKALVVMVKEMLAKTSSAAPIEVVSASPTWVELLVPCSLDEAERIEGFMAHLKTGLSEDVRRAVGQAFHELLLNAVEWGGKLDPNRKVRISYLRARRMLMYRIADPGPGFKFAELDHAAISHMPDEPTKHDEIRQKKGCGPAALDWC